MNVSDVLNAIDRATDVDSKTKEVVKSGLKVFVNENDVIQLVDLVMCMSEIEKTMSDRTAMGRLAGGVFSSSEIKIVSSPDD